jgi:ankyrin repeat protein
VHVLRLLLLRGANANIKSTSALTPLHFAASNGRAECVRALLDSGADMDASSSVRPPCSHLACFCLCANTAAALSAFSPPGCSLVQDGLTPMHCAANCGSFKCLRALAEFGANKEAKSRVRCAAQPCS